MFSWLPAFCPSLVGGRGFGGFPVTAGSANAQHWCQKLTVNFIQINNVAVAGRESGGDCHGLIPFTHGAQDGFNYICVLSLALPNTSLDQVY